MSIADAVTDSTDWLNTPLAALAPIENSLRCQVCKDFFTTPMITSCSHTFCSLCIRRYLSQEGRCPACRESDQEIKLRRNWIVEELVAQFRTRRDDILKYAQQNEVAERPLKRRKVEDIAEPERRSTRIQSRRVGEHNGISHADVVEVQDSDDESDYQDEPEDKTNGQIEDGLVACPICNRRMKETQINKHLDSNCQDIASSDSPQRSHPPHMKSLAYSQSKPVLREKLPTLNYSMFSEAALRKKLKELGIANHGSKELMRRRHIEWINLWNASCDAQQPAPTSQLRKDLDQWERTLGRQIDRGPSGVMVKEFDRDGWQKSNKGDFDDLIRQARERAAAKKQKEPDQAPSNSSAPVVMDEDDHAPNPIKNIFTQRTVTSQHFPIPGPAPEVIAESPVKLRPQTNGNTDHDHDAFNVDNEMYR